MPGYRHEVREFFTVRKQPVPADSTTETFVAMRLFIDNWRWAGVPFYLRTGKRLPKRASEVAIQFKDVPQILFNANPDVPLEPTVLSLRVQPEEGLSLRIASKLPGPKVRIYPVKMEFNYSSSFGEDDAGGLRTAAAGRDGRRRDAVHAPRRGRGGLEVRHADPGRLGERATTASCRSTGPDLGPARSRPADRGGRPALEDHMSEAQPTRPRVAEVVPEHPVPLAEIERELGSRVKALQSPGEAPLWRSCMSNLVIYCDGPELAKQLGRRGAAGRGHPPGAGPAAGGATAERYRRPVGVAVGALSPRGAGRKICSEQVTLNAGGHYVEKLSFVVRSLLIGDLPINLWWAVPQPPPLASAC